MTAYPWFRVAFHREDRAEVDNELQQYELQLQLEAASGARSTMIGGIRS